MWHEADPRITLAMDNALRTFRHELLIPNFENIPVFQQHGDADDNVPVFHSRRLHQLIGQYHDERQDTYSEIKGRGHWYEGVMTTPGLIRFYENALKEPSIPCLPKCFTIDVADAADMGSRGGIQVDALVTPGQLGRMFVERGGVSSRWTLTTSNISKFHFVSRSVIEGMPSEVVIDTQSFETMARGGHNDSCYKLDEHRRWIVRMGSHTEGTRLMFDREWKNQIGITGVNQLSQDRSMLFSDQRALSSSAVYRQHVRGSHCRYPATCFSISLQTRS